MNEEVHTMDKVEAFSCLAVCSFQTFKMSNTVDKPPALELIIARIMDKYFYKV